MSVFPVSTVSQVANNGVPPVDSCQALRRPNSVNVTPTDNEVVPRNTMKVRWYVRDNYNRLRRTDKDFINENAALEHACGIISRRADESKITIEDGLGKVLFDHHAILRYRASRQTL
jgi:hypothetical protein